MEFVDKKQQRRRIAVSVEENSVEVDDLMEECSDETCPIKPQGEQFDIAQVLSFDEVT